MSFITKEDIIFDLDVTTQKEALKKLASIAYERGKVSDENTFYEELCKREEACTTGFGNGIAIPHARHACVKEAGILFVRNQKDLDWKSIDDQPVQACVCLLAPDNSDDFHLRTLSKLARKLMHEEFIDVLKHADKDVVLKEILKAIE